MDKKDIDLIKEEFNQDRNRWTDLLLQRTFWYSELEIKVLEREFNLTLFLSSISVAFLAIGLPIIQDTKYTQLISSKISIIAFFISSLLGLVRIFWSIQGDKKNIPADSEWEKKLFSSFQRSASEIYLKARNGVVTDKDVKEYFNLKIKTDDEVSKMIKEKNKKFSNKILTLIYYFFLLLFGIGFSSLFISIWLIYFKK